MKKELKKAKKIGKAVLLGIVLVNKPSNSQEINGWAEFSAGTPTNNIRAYPSLNYEGVNLKSLIDRNGHFSFSKTDLSLEKLALKKGNFKLNPLITLYSDQYTGSKIMGGLNLSYHTSCGRGFGFAELGTDPRDIREGTVLYTYNSVNLPKGIGRIGVFTQGRINDLKSSYSEVEFTGPEKKGISPYARVNFMKGQKRTHQIGVSVNPRRLLRRKN